MEVRENIQSWKKIKFFERMKHVKSKCGDSELILEKGIKL